MTGLLICCVVIAALAMLAAAVTTVVVVVRDKRAEDALQRQREIAHFQIWQEAYRTKYYGSLIAEEDGDAPQERRGRGNDDP